MLSSGHDEPYLAFLEQRQAVPGPPLRAAGSRGAAVLAARALGLSPGRGAGSSGHSLSAEPSRARGGTRSRQWHLHSSETLLSHELWGLLTWGRRPHQRQAASSLSGLGHVALLSPVPVGHREGCRGTPALSRPLPRVSGVAPCPAEAPGLGLAGEVWTLWQLRLQGARGCSPLEGRDSS